jgi:hypothetical protein
MDTTRTKYYSRFAYVIIILVILAAAVWVGNISHVNADGTITSKNDIPLTKPAAGAESFTSVAPDPSSKNTTDRAVPSNSMGTTLSNAPDPSSKNYAGDYQP